MDNTNPSPQTNPDQTAGAPTSGTKLPHLVEYCPRNTQNHINNMKRLYFAS